MTLCVETANFAKPLYRGMTLHPGEEGVRHIYSQEHLTIAALECRPGKNNGEPNPSSCLLLKVRGIERVVCTLEKGLAQQQSMDLVLQEKETVTFIVEGTGTIYLTGYSSESLVNTSEDTEYEQNEILVKAELEDNGYNDTIDDASTEQSSAMYGMDNMPTPEEIVNTMEDIPNDNDIVGALSASHASHGVIDDTAQTSAMYGMDNMSTPEEIVDTRQDIHNAIVGALSASQASHGVRDDTGQSSAMFRMDNMSTPEEMADARQDIPNNHESDGALSANPASHRIIEDTGQSLNHESSCKIECVVEISEVSKVSEPERKDDARPTFNHQASVDDNNYHNAEYSTASHSSEMTGIGYSGQALHNQANAEVSAPISAITAGDQSCYTSRHINSFRDDVSDPGNSVGHISTENRSQPATSVSASSILNLNSRRNISYADEQTNVNSMPERFFCVMCSITFTERSAFIKHTSLHSRLPDTFSQMGNRFQYGRRTRVVEKPFKCRYCGKGFIHRGHLEKHVRIHTGEKPYKCQYCGKAFNQKGSRNVHERIHTGEKPYKCKYCFKTFSYMGNCQVHERTHTGMKPFKCQFCDKVFARSANKKQHELLIHNIKT